MASENMDRSTEVENDDECVCVICKDWLSTHIELAKMTPCK